MNRRVLVLDDDPVHRMLERTLVRGDRRRLGFIPLVVDEISYIPFDPEAANLMFSLVSARYERASMMVTSNKRFSAWGGDLRRRRRRRGDDRSPRPPRRDTRPEGRHLPTARQGSRLPAAPRPTAQRPLSFALRAPLRGRSTASGWTSFHLAQVAQFSTGHDNSPLLYRANICSRNVPRGAILGGAAWASLDELTFPRRPRLPHLLFPPRLSRDRGAV
jgi:hypothetical protein